MLNCHLSQRASGGILKKELHAPERFNLEYVNDKAASSCDAAFLYSQEMKSLVIEVVSWCVRTGTIQDRAQLADPNRA